MRNYTLLIVIALIIAGIVIAQPARKPIFLPIDPNDPGKPDEIKIEFVNEKTCRITTTKLNIIIVERDRAELQTELDHIPDRKAEIQEQLDRVNERKAELIKILEVFK